MGKSRLVYEFVHSHHTPGWSVLKSASVSYGKATPYFPAARPPQALQSYRRPRRYTHHSGQADRAGIDAGCDSPGRHPGVAALLEALPDDSPFRQLDPAQRRQRTLTALKRVLLRESQVQPLLLVCEDLHWIDTETQALLDSLAESLPTTSSCCSSTTGPSISTAGQQDLLHATAAGPIAAAERRRVLARPARGRRQPATGSLWRAKNSDTFKPMGPWMDSTPTTWRPRSGLMARYRCNSTPGTCSSTPPAILPRSAGTARSTLGTSSGWGRRAPPRTCGQGTWWRSRSAASVPSGTLVAEE